MKDLFANARGHGDKPCPLPVSVSLREDGRGSVWWAYYATEDESRVGCGEFSMHTSYLHTLVVLIIHHSQNHTPCRHHQAQQCGVGSAEGSVERLHPAPQQ
ncbi:hypothetical protein EON63_22785 [archaeon]|nr:MAG: hypothetical protein EON63_22785 [archaeon]